MGAAGAAFGQPGMPWYESQNIQIVSKTSKLRTHQISACLAAKCCRSQKL